MHVGRASALGSILDRCGDLPALEPRDGQKIEHGFIYVAPSDRHLTLTDGHIHISRGPRENRHRPAVDPLFRSAARLYRERVIGVVLTGGLDDGSAGLFSVKSRGGIAIVQDPEEAVEPGMPRNALRNVEVDHCLPLRRIAPLLVNLTREKLPTKARPARQPEKEAGTARKTPPGFRGDAVSFVCPECNGPLYEEREGKLLNFHCQVGHSFSPESLTAAHTDALERALWIAIRTLNERIAINEALAQRQLNDPALSRRLAETASRAAEDVARLREILERL